MSDQATSVGTPTPATAPLPNNFTGSSTGEPVGSSQPAAAGATPPATPPAAPSPPAAGGTAAPAKSTAPTMPEESLNARLERARRKAREDTLRELGVTDPAKVKAELAEFAKLKAEREKADREKMTREQQLVADLEAEKAKRTELETQLKQARIEHVYEQQDAMIANIARRHVDPNKLKLNTARREFGDYVQSLPESQRDRLREKDIDRWFAKFAKDNPDFAPKPDAPQPPPAPVRKPITTTTPAAKSKPQPAPASTSSDPSVNSQGKTFRPGQSNSMSRAEAAAEMKRLNIKSYR